MADIEELLKEAEICLPPVAAEVLVVKLAAALRAERARSERLAEALRPFAVRSDAVDHLADEEPLSFVCLEKPLGILLVVAGFEIQPGGLPGDGGRSDG